MKPGGKVICVDASIDPNKIEEISKDFESWIKKDQEYTIREVLDNDGIVTGILLEEVYNIPKFFKLLNRYQEPAFATWRFREMQKPIVHQLHQEEKQVLTIFLN